MARKLRIQYPGAIYHVMTRGDHQERVFCDDDDREGFLATLAQGCDKTGWQVHSYCLMTNHLRVGSKEFRAEMLAYIEEQRGKWHYGAERSESAEAKPVSVLTFYSLGRRTASPASPPPEVRGATVDVRSLKSKRMATAQGKS